MSDDILITDNRTSLSTTLHHNEDHSVKNISLEMIEKMILKFSTSDKSELREINRISTNITAKLNHHYQNNLEYRNHRIMQWVSQLETINDDCYQCIGELWSELCTLCRMKNDDNSLEGLRKGFLLEKKVNDGRKKRYESVDSSDEASEPFGLSEYDSDSYRDESSRNDKEYTTDED